VSNQDIREALNQHWAASDAGDFATEHDIYLEDAVLDYPQSRERIVGRQNIQITRTVQPNKKHFDVRRIIGSGQLWITELVMTYDGQPFYTVSIMEFRGVKVAHETQYFAGPFEAAQSRKKWVESMDSPKDQASFGGALA
jgi:ketosteroid isomerase-like protein